MLGLLLLVLGTVLGMALQWQPTPPPSPTPPDGRTAADGPGQAADGDFRRTAPGADGTGAEPPSPSRVAIGDDAAPAAHRSLAVHVVALQGDGGKVRVPFVEVMVEVDGDVRRRVLARTDRDGVATFRFADDAPHRVRAVGAAGGTAETTLQAHEQVLEVAFTPRAIASGEVVDRAGRGVGDADLVLLRWPDADGDEPLFRIGRSAADGSFRVPVGVGGRLGAVSAQYAPSALRLLRASPAGADPLPQSFELVLFGDAATVRGVVVDDDGRAVPGARLCFESREPRPAGSERTAPPQQLHADANGEFVASGLTPGLLTVSAWADGYGWQQDELRVAADGQAFVTLLLPWPSRVVGVVETAHGAPVPGARVVAGTAGSWLHVATRADGDGRFELVGLGSGPVPLRASDGGLSVQTELELEPGANREWRAVLGSGTQGPVLRGVVVDADERPRPDWRIVVGRKGVLPRSTFTAADGTFAVNVPVADDLEVRAFAAGRPLSGFADALLRGVAVDDGPVRIVLDAAPPGSVRAVIAAQDGGPLPATVGAWHHERREYARFAATADGVLVVGPVPAGTLDLGIEHPGYARRDVRDRPLAAGDEVDLGQILLDRAGSLFGTVRGPGGSLPESCELNITVDDQVLAADYQGGSYRFPALPAGTHRLRVKGPGLGGAAFAVEIRAGEDLERNLELELGLRRRFVVTAPTGCGGSVNLALKRDDGEVHWLATAALVAAPGAEPTASFLVHMTGGSYRALAWTDAAHAVEREVEFRFDGEPDVTLQLR